MLRYLLDTNIISEPTRPIPNKGILTQLQTHRTEIAIASVTWHELWYGCERLPEGKKRTTITRYLQEVVSTLPILFYDAQAAFYHATERARLTQQGQTPPYIDEQIAAIAVTQQLTLVTQNSADFQHLHSLQLVNWAS